MNQPPSSVARNQQDTARALALRLLPLLDLTSLGEDDSPAHIRALCTQACTPHGAVAAVCVYPEHATTARRSLEGTGVRVACVVNFPDGSADAARIERETRRAVAAGAQEIDLVLPWRALLAGDASGARACVDACRRAGGGGVALKLILETGALQSAEHIRHACLVGLQAGVDFLKTSTGKAAVNATPDAAAVMLDVIAEHAGGCGFKAAGGIRRVDEAATYLQLARARLGDDWITPARMRFGASALLQDILRHLECQPEAG